MDRRDFLKTASTATSAAATEQLLTPLLREAGGCCEHRFQELLDQALSAAKSFKPFSSAELASLLERTRSAA